MDSRYCRRPAQETALPRGLLEAVFWEQDLDLCWLPAWHRQHPHSAQPAPAATAPLLLSGKHPGEGRGPPATSPDLRPIFNKSLPGLISSPARGRAATCWARGRQRGAGQGLAAAVPELIPPQGFWGPEPWDGQHRASAVSVLEAAAPRPQPHRPRPLTAPRVPTPHQRLEGSGARPAVPLCPSGDNY